MIVNGIYGGPILGGFGKYFLILNIYYISFAMYQYHTYIFDESHLVCKDSFFHNRQIDLAFVINRMIMQVKDHTYT